MMPNVRPGPPPSMRWPGARRCWPSSDSTRARRPGNAPRPEHPATAAPIDRLRWAMHPRAAALIDQLGLIPHPEGGFYRELHRSAVAVQPLDGRPPRTGLTTIYFLLPEGAHSRWHRVTSDEAWHLYEGSPLDLF